MSSARPPRDAANDRGGDLSPATLTVRMRSMHGTHAPIVNARMTWRERPSWRVEVRDEAGARGFGEATPLPGHSPERLEEVTQDLARLASISLTSAPPPKPSETSWAPLIAWLGDFGGSVPTADLVSTASVRFALEAALLDYWARRLGVPLWRLLARKPVAQELPATTVIDPLAGDPLAAVERWHSGEGLRTLKFKLGRDFERELDVLRRVRDRYPREQLKLRLDVNRCWPPDLVAERLALLAPLEPEFLEEPCAAFDGLAESPVPIARDESLLERTPDPEWLAAQRGVAVVVLKPMLLGGISRCLEWAEAAQSAGKQVVLSHLFDGPLGLAATAQLAFALQAPELAPGLGWHPGLAPWRAEIAPPDFLRTDRFVLPEAPGLGTTPTRRLSVLAAARECPERVALCWDDREVRFAALARSVQVVMQWLEAEGHVERARASGRPVAFVAAPRLPELAVLYACLELGVPVLPLHPRATPREQQEWRAELAPALFVDGEALDALSGALEAALSGSTLAPPHAPDPRPELPEPTSAALSPAAPALAEPTLPDPDPETDLAWLLTSGSTGRPRAVRLSRRAFLASADASSLRLGWQADDRWLLSLPFAHVGGLSVLTRCLLARRTVVLTKPSADPSAWLTAATNHRVTLLSLVPTQLARLLESGAALPPSVRAVLVGGARASGALIARARERGIPAIRTYGLTEACSQVATERLPETPSVSSPDGSPQAGALSTAAPNDDGAVGPVLLGVEVRIGPDDVIELRGDTLFSGYVGGEPQRAEPTLDGWFRTSDRGQLRGGILRVEGRVDHVIVSGGENVSAEGVESVVAEHAAVREVCVVGAPDATWGARVVACVSLREAASVEELDEWARERIASYARPRAWLVLDELPRLPSGKVDRRAVARWASEQLASPTSEA